MNASLRNHFTSPAAIDSNDRSDYREVSYRNDVRLADVYLDSVIVGSRMNLSRQFIEHFKT
jgi:hypothetical protein